MISIAICDQHPMILMGLIATVNGEPDMEVVYQSTSVHRLMQNRSDIQPHIFVLDLDLNNKESLQHLGILNRQYPVSKIIVYSTGYNTANQRERLLQATQLGVSGFLGESARPGELINAIRVVSNGGLSLDQRVKEQIFSQPPKTSPHDSELSPREREVLQLLAIGKSNVDIADSLFVCERTVKFHVSSILKKLNLRNRTQAALYARRHNVSHIYSEN